MTSYFVKFYCYKSCWRQQIFEFSIEIERAYQELIKNVVHDNFHQLNWKWWLVMRGLGARIELALAVACWFWFFVVICWGCVCVFGVRPMFPGFYRVCRGWFFGDNRLNFVTNWRKLERLPYTYIRVRGVLFVNITSSMRSYAWTFNVSTAINSSMEERGILIYWSWRCLLFKP